MHYGCKEIGANVKSPEIPSSRNPIILPGVEAYADLPNGTLVYRERNLRVTRSFVAEL
jgi:hypothetical protein